jgi:hypothetical protein
MRRRVQSGNRNGSSTQLKKSPAIQRLSPLIMKLVSLSDQPYAAAPNRTNAIV